jgi:hypothetical protein
MPDVKDIKGKTRWDVLDFSFFIGMARVMTMGCEKYGYRPWDHIVDNANPEDYFSALMRHISKWRMGEKIDEESGLSHLYHAAINLMILQSKEDKNESV